MYQDICWWLTLALLFMLNQSVHQVLLKGAQMDTILVFPFAIDMLFARGLETLWFSFLWLNIVYIRLHRDNILQSIILFPCFGGSNTSRFLRI